MAVKPVPDGYHTVTPYLTVRGAPKVIEFAKRAFGAELAYEPVKRPDGTLMPAGEMLEKVARAKQALESQH